MYRHIVVQDTGGLFVLVDGLFECKHLNRDTVVASHWPSQEAIDLGNDYELLVKQEVCLDCDEVLNV